MKPDIKKIIATVAILSLIIVSVFVQVIGVFYYPNGNWDSDPSVDKNPGRIWDIKDSQVLRSYNAGPVLFNPLKIIDNTYHNKKIESIRGHGIEIWDNTPTEWIADNTTIVILAEDNKTSTMSFNVISFNRPRTLEIYDNDQLIFRQQIGTEFNYVRIPFSMSKGVNKIRFVSVEGSEQPKEVLGNNDQRNLSFAFQNIQYL